MQSYACICFNVCPNIRMHGMDISVWIAINVLALFECVCWKVLCKCSSSCISVLSFFFVYT